MTEPTTAADALTELTRLAREYGLEIQVSRSALPESDYDTKAGPTTQQIADSRFLEHERTVSCTHAEGCICIESAHASCCGVLREQALARLAVGGK